MIHFCFQNYVSLNEQEVMDRFVVIEERKKRIYERQQREQRRLDRKRQALEMARRLEEVKMKKHADHQGKYIRTCILSQSANVLWLCTFVASLYITRRQTLAI